MNACRARMWQKEKLLKLHMYEMFQGYFVFKAQINVLQEEKTEKLQIIKINVSLPAAVMWESLSIRGSSCWRSALVLAFPILGVLVRLRMISLQFLFLPRAGIKKHIWSISSAGCCCTVPASAQSQSASIAGWLLISTEVWNWTNWSVFSPGSELLKVSG